MSIGNKNKSDLNLYCQKSRIAIATYTSSTQDGQFVSKVNVNGTEYCSTSGYSTKKEAENDAAGVALIAVLQKEFGGKSIEEALAILEQKHPSKNKKKSKQASSNAALGVAQSGTQVLRNAENTQIQTDSSSGQIDSSSTAQLGGVARTPQMPPPQQQQLQQQELSVESPHVVQKQSQIHSGGPQSVIIRPMMAQSGGVMGQYQAAATAAYSYKQTVMRPRSPGVLQQSQPMSQAPQQQHQQVIVRPNQSYVADSHSQQAAVQAQDYHADGDDAWSQGVVMVTPKGGGGGGGGAREQGQRTQGQPSSASSANVIHHPTTGSGEQAPPTQAYAPHTAGHYYHHPMQRYPPASIAVYRQYCAPPYMQPAYVHQAPPMPTSGHHWSHPQPHPPHPRLINSNPPGAYPPSSTPPTSYGQQTVTPPTGVRVGTAPPPGARSMAARFPGTAPSPPLLPSSSSQQLQPMVPSSQGSLPPPPPGFSADQSAASPGQTVPNKPLNAIPVSKLTGQGLPSSTAGDARQDAESASRKDVSKNLQLVHTKQLEELCKTRNLPAPHYKINEEKRKFFASVMIGHQLFRTQWPCESMEQAKSTAAMEAIVNLTMSMSELSTSDTGNQQQSESSRSSSASSLQANPTTSLAPTTPSPLPSQTAKGQSSSAHSQQVKQQQTLSSTQRPLPSPSNTAAATTDNPRPALQPPSFFTNNNNPPNPPTNTTAPSTTQIQSKSVKEEIQPSPQPQSPASSRTKAMAVNYKQMLNIHCQRNHIAHVYECAASEDAVGYVATVKVSGRVFTSKNHGTKRAAETDAAGEAVKALGLVGPQGEYQPQQGQGKTGSGYHGGGGHTQPSSVSQPQGMVSYKNLLQEHVQKQGLTLPHYETERVEEGFKSTVKVHRHGNESLTFTSSPQPVKKGAEQEAAKAACLELNLIH